MHRRHSFLSDEPPPPRSPSGVDTVSDLDEVLVVPRRSDPPPKTPFPIIGSLAPLGAAVVVWFVLHSPLALVFALLSPVMAVASLLDGRLTARRARRRDDVDLERRKRAFVDRVATFHAHEIALLRRLAPSARSVLGRTSNPFTATSAGDVAICLGTGQGRSGLRLEGGSDDDDDSRRLRSVARRLVDAPVLAPSPVRIAVVGAPTLANAIARGYVVQFAAAVSPRAVRFLAGSAGRNSSPGSWTWAHSLPHFGDDDVSVGSLDAARRPLCATFIVVADSIDIVPAEADIVVAADSVAKVTVLRHPRFSTPFEIEGEFVSVLEAEEFGRRLGQLTGETDETHFELPSRVSAAEVEALIGTGVGGGPSPEGLSAAIGIGEHGDVVSLDLVEQGPHAVVAGTTGSGKSELLVTWVAALARAYESTAFTVLLVDFKGGAAFDPLTGLEQCVGLITDLDPGGAERALSSLRAEVRWRERALREASVRDISDPRLGARMPRLLIVVDEFAAMLSEFPQLHDVFADIAARGRSLGMHLVLCTQRPAGVVKDSLLANCELRLSLRVNNAADSTAIIGSPAASMLAPEQRGRCLVSVGGRPPVVVQVAHTDAADLVGQRPTTPPSLRAPWLPALASEILLDDVPRPPSGIVLGLLDLPEEQRQPPACYDPAEQGPLLILGSSRSGKSTLLSTIAQQSSTVVFVGPGIEEAWDTVQEVVELCRERQRGGVSHPPILVFVDDLDSVVRRFEAEYQSALVSALATILRDGPPCGVTLIATAQRLAAPLTMLAPLFPERIHLRFASRQEYIVAEGIPSDHDAGLPSGAGHWRGARLQVALPSEGAATRASTPSRHVRIRGGSLPPTLLVVTSRPTRFLDPQHDALPETVALIDVGDRAALSAFAATCGVPTWLVGTPDAWMAAWSTFSSLRSRFPVYLDGCSLGDLRSLTRRRDLPPPFDHGRPPRWLLAPDDTIVRFEPAEVSHR
ncbi:FtsK/SpoIIIE domain-containing protein [Agreia pratensis]|uniref:DNA segregation ATPase FtsK/SpoIIIE, S-DNA-T family n=1 Tax=Agreia pratensis TaxID=150121 RepID=A0A1X7K722_9MICO|nr:FtsK/SpoIIIE domain-containing protein [Agreia pratensis]SMG36074.1 DNA segregation ATPase FtsK/SpoIIIE, S-DNA-T family [Agreia pratensis]